MIAAEREFVWNNPICSNRMRLRLEDEGYTSVQKSCLIGSFLAFACALFSANDVYARCVISDEICHGCGCKGGPGYREIASGKCVGFKQLDKKCGSPPSSLLCAFENAPGTGANRECALEPKKKKALTE